MGTSPVPIPSRDLETLFSVGTVGGLSDGQLLGRFAARREEAAFEALIQRHGPMVWGVCRRILRDHHDAEDAFQATFLVLARKAPSIAHRELVANWLYAVAHKSAMRARALASKRRARERRLTELPDPAAESEGTRDELLAQLDRELSRLPDKYRVPIVLCELEGKTHKQAAEQLGWPIGTVSGRLSRARVMLARRLSRTGVRLSVASLAELLASETASAGIPTKLIGPTTQAATLSATAGRTVAAGMVSAEVAGLTREVLKTMLLSKIKFVTVGLLALVCTGIGVVMASRALATDQEPSRTKAETGAEDLTKEEMKRLQGTWIVTKLEQVDHQPTESEKEYWRSGKFTITIKGNRLIYNTDNSFADFKLDPSQTPKLMTMEMPDGPNKGRHVPAIYRLEGNDLMFCQGRLGDTEPPVEFSIENRRPRTFPTLWVLKRQPSLQENFRATVNEVIHDDSIIVTQIGIETLPGAWVEVLSDKPNRGGGGVKAASTDPPQPDGLALSQIVIFADHAEWKAGSANTLKFMMKFRGAGTSTMSDTGPMPDAKRLSDLVTVAIKPGEYKYGVATNLVTFKDVTYSLVVKKPK